MIVQQLLQVCINQVIPVHLLLEERFRVTFLLWGSITQCLLTVKLASRISLAVAVKFLMMSLQLKYVCLLPSKATSLRIFKL